MSTRQKHQETDQETDRTTPQPAELCVVGPIRVVIGDQATEVTTAKLATLFSLLAIHRKTRTSEAKLIEELWQGDPPPAAKSAFRTYLAQVRKLLGPERIISEGSSYQLNPRLVRVDLDSVAASLDQIYPGLPCNEMVTRLGALARALDGGFFVGADDADAIVEERRYLEELAATTRMDWLAARLDAGESSLLVPALRRLVRSDPEDERRTELLMRALAQSGNRRAALAAYRDLYKVLAELGMTPSAQVQSLERSILVRPDRLVAVDDGLVVPPDADAAAAHFAGRLELVEELARGDLHVALTVGRTGSGKTALAVHVARELAGAGLRVRYGVATGTGQPLAALLQALPGLERLVAQEAPVAGIAGVADSLIVEEIVRIAIAGPTLCLVLDDMHAADFRTLAVIALLASEHSVPIVIRLFARPGAEHRLDQVMARVAISLAPLTRTDVTALLRQRLGRAPEQHALDWVMDVSAGWAILVAAMASYLATGGSSTAVSGTATTGTSKTGTAKTGTAWPAGPALGLAFTPFDVTGQHILAAIAYADAAVGPATISAWTGVPVEVVSDVIDQATAVELLLPGGEGNTGNTGNTGRTGGTTGLSDRGLGPALRFRHPLLSAHAQSELSAEDRRQLSSIIAADAQLPLWIRARHALVSVNPADWDATLDLVISACEAANRAGRAEIAQALVRTAMLERGDVVTSARHRFKLLDVSSVSLELQGDPETAADVRFTAFSVAEQAGLVEEAVRCALRGPASGRSVSDEVQRALTRRALNFDLSGLTIDIQVAAELVFTTLFHLDPPGPAVIQAIARLVASLADEHDPQTTAMIHRALYLARVSHLTDTDAAEHIRVMIDAAMRTDHLDLQSMALDYGINFAIATGSADDVRTAVARHQRFAEGSGRPADVWARDVVEATMMQLVGRRPTARNVAWAARQFGHQHAAGDTEIAWLLHLLCTVVLAGNPADPADQATVREYPVWGPMLLDCGSMTPDEAAFPLNGLIDALLLLPINVGTLTSLAWVTELMWITRQCEPAERMLARFTESVGHERFIVVGHLPVGTAGPVDRVHAMLLAMRGVREDDDRIIALFRSAFAASERLGARAWSVKVLHDQAEFYHRRDRVTDAMRCADSARAFAAFEHVRNVPQRGRSSR